MSVKETTPKDVLEKELKELETKWAENMKTKYKAGGNSGDNMRMAQIRVLLKSGNQ